MRSLASSFRDDAGFVFEQGGKIYRYIHPRYFDDHALLVSSGLYDELMANNWMVSHEDVTGVDDFGLTEGKVILPKQIPFISYPYEWSFDMWKDAALLTLQITSLALKHGMILKDASPFNIQFLDGKPVFIDTLSFEKYEEGAPWVAYRQFCESFLGPLLLMHYCYPPAQKLFIVYPNGIPLQVLVNLLPARSKWNLNTFLHIHLQSRITGNNKNKSSAKKYLSKNQLDLLLQGLISFSKKLRVKKMGSAWDDYYSDTICSNEYLDEKTKMVMSFSDAVEFRTMIDLGCNDGHFSLLFRNSEKQIIAIDEDVNCVNALYNKIRAEGISNIQPLVADLASPSPAIGWNNGERSSLNQRLKADIVLALALIQHLAIGNNIPLPMIAAWLRPMAEWLLIEFVPKEDEKLQMMLKNRKDIFHDYTLADFKAAFSDQYGLVREEKIGNTSRVLFLMKRK